MVFVIKNYQLNQKTLIDFVTVQIKSQKKVFKQRLIQSCLTKIERKIECKKE